jgi:hypothetical protein
LKTLKQIFEQNQKKVNEHKFKKGEFYYTITTYEKDGEKNQSPEMTKEEVSKWIKKRKGKDVMSITKWKEGDNYSVEEDIPLKNFL